MGSEQAFKVGDRVRVIDIGPRDSYARRSSGVIRAVGTLTMVAPAIRDAKDGWLGADLANTTIREDLCFLQCKLEKADE